MKHCFISVHKNDINVALNYYKNPELLVAKKHEIAWLNDKFVLRYKELFLNINVYVQKLSNKDSKLDYYGRTIIPVETVREIKERVSANKRLYWNSKINREVRGFMRLLENAIDNNYFIVHLGV